MAYSSDPAETGRTARGFLPPQNEEERRLMRRVEELCTLAQRRGIPRYTGFLSDREQSLAEAAANRAQVTCIRFWGGFEDAERRVLCIEPEDAWQEEPVACLRLRAHLAPGAEPPAHREILGAVLGLGLERTCLGDIRPDPDHPGDCYLFLLQDKLDFVSANLTAAGHVRLDAAPCDQPPQSALREPERQLRQATVSSLRADSVLAAMLHTSRGQAAQVISEGRVQVNHVPLRSAHDAVYAGDIFTVRGSGRYRLQEIGGKSRSDRTFILFYQY